MYNSFSAFLPVEVLCEKKSHNTLWLEGMQKETKFLPSHQGRKNLASDVAAEGTGVRASLIDVHFRARATQNLKGKKGGARQMLISQHANFEKQEYNTAI